jgi:hypothetical protein
MSYRYRRMKMSMVEAHDAAKNVSAFSMLHVFNDAIMAFMGFTFGNLISADYIYKRRIYVIERLYFEKQQNFNRYTYNTGGKLSQEYPFAEYITLRDKDIIEDRIHPREIEEETAIIR